MERLSVDKFTLWAKRWSPGVHRWLHALLSGLMWSGVGIMLCSLAAEWLEEMSLFIAALLAAGGAALAYAIYRFGFSRIAAKNMQRISAMQGRVCIFAFQEWKSYLIVVVMITLGRLLRLSPFPKPALAVLYTGIGGGLFLSSLAYYRQSWMDFRKRFESE